MNVCQYQLHSILTRTASASQRTLFLSDDASIRRLAIRGRAMGIVLRAAACVALERAEAGTRDGILPAWGQVPGLGYDV